MKEQIRVAYLMSRFPKLTETFILYEILALEEEGVQVEVFPLLRERQPVSHPEAESVIERAHYQPFLSWPIVAANWHFATRRPRRYFRALVKTLRATWGSWNFFLGAAAIFPKVVRFARLMEQLGIGHVHAHFANHPAAAAFVIHHLTGIPYSFTAHGADLHVETRMLAEKVEASAFTVTVSDFNREFIVRECGERVRPKIVVNHCGVDLDRFVPRSAHQNAGVFHILCVASLEPVKGHRYLIRACRRLSELKFEWRCSLVGDGPMRESIAQSIQDAGLAGRMVLLGPLPRPQVIDLLKQADAVVLPSVQTPEGKREGIPVALMEAMASAVPVISSRLSGIPELVVHGKTGFLAEPGDSDGLADYLQRLAGSPDLRQRLGLAGRQRVARRFDLRANARELAHLFARQIGDLGSAEASAERGLPAPTRSTA